MSKWKCEICGNEFENFHAQGFDNKIYCPLCYFKKKYETTMFEKEQLNSLVNSCQEEIRRLKKQLQERPKEFKNQQKEFIEYMNKTIEELECDDVDDEEMKAYLIQRIDTFKEILSKYSEIIGDYI